MKMLTASAVLCLVLTSSVLSVDLNDVSYSVKSTYDELLEDGKRAYSAQDWGKAIEYFEAAISDYLAEKNGMVECYGECRNESQEKVPLEADAGEQKIMRHLLVEAQCSEACKRRRLGLRGGSILKSIRKDFAMAHPYHYLQYAYFQVGNVTRAAAAASTFAIFNPKDEQMQKNLAIYRNMSEVKAEHLLPLMNPSGRVLFDRAAGYYQGEVFKKVVATMPVAVDTFFNEYHVCCSNCDASAGMESDNEDDESANDGSFLSLALKMQRKQVTCRLQCWIDTGSDFHSYHSLDVLPEAFNYIQFSMNKESNPEGAMQAVMDYLQLKPHDEIMQSNLKYYESQGLNRADFTPSPAVAAVTKQVAEDRRMLHLLKDSVRTSEEAAFRDELGIDDPANAEDVEAVFLEFAEFQRSVKTDTTATSDSSSAVGDDGSGAENTLTNRGDTGQYRSSDSTIRDKRDVRRNAKISPVAGDDEIFESVLSETPADRLADVTIVETQEDHNGLSRVLIDGLASQEQCNTMLDLAKEGKPGSGYGGRSSPHTDKELFEGLTVEEAAQGAENGTLSTSSVLLYLDLAEQSRKFLEKHFLLEHLYFSYSHLVCRSSLVDGSEVKLDELKLSHPVHADNCILKEDGRCVKESPAYTWRDYSAILYLNEDFIGGDFFFAHRNNQTVQHRVRPKCGRLVGFGAGEENLHGVLPLLSGRRCVVALWMTLEFGKDEGNHAETIVKLEQLREEQELRQRQQAAEEMTNVDTKEEL